jgi:hypothetical protein
VLGDLLMLKHQRAVWQGSGICSLVFLTRREFEVSEEGPVRTGLFTMRGLLGRESENSRRELFLSFLRFALDRYDNSPYIYGMMSYCRLNMEDHQSEATTIG